MHKAVLQLCNLEERTKSYMEAAHCLKTRVQDGVIEETVKRLFWWFIILKILLKKLCEVDEMFPEIELVSVF